MAAANLIVISTYYLKGTSPTLADSEGNTWNPLLEKVGSTSANERMWVCFAPTTSASHTFSLTGTGTYCSIAVMAFSGAQTSPLDQEGAGQDSTDTPAVTILNTAAITTGQANTIIVYSLGDNAPTTGDAATVNTLGAGAVIAQQVPLLAATSFANCVVYHIVSSVQTGYQPQFSFASTTNAMAKIASFKHDGTGAYVASAVKQGTADGTGNTSPINTAGTAGPSAFPSHYYQQMES